jgi:hypothetical protein
MSIRYRKAFLFDGHNIFKILNYKFGEKLRYNEIEFIEPNNENPLFKESYTYKINEYLFYDLSDVKPMIIANAEKRKKIEQEYYKDKSMLDILILKTGEKLPSILDKKMQKSKDSTEDKKHIRESLKQRLKKEVLPIKINPSTMYITRLNPKELKTIVDMNAFEKISKQPLNLGNIDKNMLLYGGIGLVILIAIVYAMSKGYIGI